MAQKSPILGECGNARRGLRPRRRRRVKDRPGLIAARLLQLLLKTSVLSSSPNPSTWRAETHPCRFLAKLPSRVTLVKNYGRRASCRQQNSHFRGTALCRRVPTPVASMLAAASEIARNPQTSQSGFEPAAIRRMSGGICLVSLPLVRRFLTSREKVGHGSGRK